MSRKAKEAGIKHDEGKLEYHLLPWTALEQVVRVMMMGRDKYGAFNWKNGISSTRYFDAGLRHAVARFKGQTQDPESHLDHLAHVAANALMDLETYIEQSAKFDDRPGQ